MNFSPQTKAWILLICIVISTAGGVFVTSYLGGSKWWIALICGFVTAASNIYHALAASPADKQTDNKPTE